MDEKEKLIDFYYSRLQAVRRAQKHYLALLLALLGIVWIPYWGGPAAFSASFLGVPITHKSWLGMTPGLSTILLLGLVGSLRALQPALQRFKEAWTKAGTTAKLDLEVIDQHQNWMDYLKNIWAGPFNHLLQGALLLAVMASTFAVGLILGPKMKGEAAFLFTTYSLFCLAAQAAASWKWLAERIRISRRHG
ncbi:MAG: hypothetical protein ACE5HL_08080 [Terriglobia bacterium]